MSLRCLSIMALLIFGSPWLVPSSFRAWISPQRTTRDMEAPQRGQYIRPVTDSLRFAFRRGTGWDRCRKPRVMDLRTNGRGQSRFYPETRSFVAQALNGVEAGGVDGGGPAADDGDQTQNDRRHNQAAQVDVEVNVSPLEVVAKGAHQWERPHGPGNYVGDCDAGEASGEGDGQGFGEKLQQDVGFVRAQRLFYADFAGALLDRDQHDVHKADAADAEGERADESEQDLKRGDYDGELVEVLLEIGHEYGASVVGAEIVVSRQHGANHASQLLVVFAFVVHEEAGDVFGVVEVAHGAEGNGNEGVVIVVAPLDLTLVDTPALH